MWGQVAIGGEILGALRIIPTRVGTRQVMLFLSMTRTDHPHACGDKFALTKIPLSHSGSSPRVWGQAELVKIYGIRVGIIPTRVGTSYTNAFFKTVHKDHPHACGDKYDIG